MQAKGLLSEYQPKYNSARAVYRERKKYADEIDWNMLAVPPSGSYKAIIASFCYLLLDYSPNWLFLFIFCYRSAVLAYYG